MQMDSFYELSDSSQNALAWAYTLSQQRAPSKEVPISLVSALDIFAGILLAHPENSELYQLFKHYNLASEILFETLRVQGGFAPEKTPSSAEYLDRMPPLDNEGEKVIQMSFILSGKLNPEPEHLIRSRDLFGGILMGTPNKAYDLLQKVLERAEVPFERIVVVYPEFLNYPSDKMSFDKFLAERFPLPQIQYTDMSNAIQAAVSGFSADIRTKRDEQDPIDHIGIGAEVDAFSYLIAAKDLKPPMAIGLFGDWGSGKSFFMESLRTRIHKITEDAQKSKKSQGEIYIYKYIAQIEFNAWHYVEGELWASLVEHIFRNLKTRSEDELPLLQQRQQVVIEKLKLKRLAQQEAQVRQAELKSQLLEKKALVTSLEKDRDDALKTLNELKAKDILKAIPLTDFQTDIEILKDLGLRRDMKNKAELKNAAELMQGADELCCVLERGNALITPLRRRDRNWAVVLIFVILIGPIISLLLLRFVEIPAVTNALVSIAAFLSGLTIVLKKGTIWLANAQAKADGVRIRLDARRNEEDKQNRNEILKAQRNYEKTAADYYLAKKQEKEKAREIDELEQELQRLTPGRLLLDFINERVGSQDYRKHLGIAALIHNDFKQLSKLIEDQNDKFKDDDGTIEKKEQHLINRIVLYIDDLDRCPPERVVQVLEAVHLLLAFPLFVVVVAVDARWLSQSLQAHYKKLLAANSPRNSIDISKGFSRQASPQDYLEKIFQIPFWVRPLAEEARINIVKGLLKRNGKQSSDTHGEVSNIQVVGQPAFEATIDTIIGEEPVSDSLILPHGGRLLDLKAKTDLKPEGLDIEKIELNFMNELSSLLGQTPRSVKRFVNVYRLIKVISLNQKAKFVEDRPDADFKLVLFLLAVLTGLPTISREFFRQLRAERSEFEQSKIPGQRTSMPIGHNLGQVLQALRGIVLGMPQTHPVDMVSAGKGATVTSEKAGNGLASDWSYEKWDIYRDLDRLESWLKKYNGGSWLDLDATAFADWAPQVVRFSYRLEEL
jgi:hypothetical protein